MKVIKYLLIFVICCMVIGCNSKKEVVFMFGIDFVNFDIIVLLGISFY